MTLCLLLGSAIAQPGFIQVRAELGIRVFLDGQPVGVTDAAAGGLILMNIPTGERRLRFEKDGYRPQQTTVQLAPRQVLLVELEPWSRASVTLVIQCVPVECVVNLPSLGLREVQKGDAELMIREAPIGVHSGSLQLRIGAGTILPMAVTLCGDGDTVRVLGIFIGSQPEFRVESALGFGPACQVPTGTLASGSAHALALQSNGGVWAWGLNEFGQLGDGSQTNRTSPVEVTGLSAVRAVAAGVGHSLALRDDGGVWGWGRNEYGQLGAGARSNKLTAQPIRGLTQMRMVAAGHYHSLALRDDGTVWAWGGNGAGQLGDGTTRDRSEPRQIPGLNDVMAIAAGRYFSAALRADGTVWTWGLNSQGQLGVGDLENRSTPTVVPGLTDVRSLATGWARTLVAKIDGSVWAWGFNDGAHGDGTRVDSTRPVQALGVSDAVTVAAGGWHSLAITADGALWAWGYGNVGNGRSVSSLTPVRVPGLRSVVGVAAGEKHTLALDEAGGLWIWGVHASGEVGFGDPSGLSQPQPESEATDVGVPPRSDIYGDDLLVIALKRLARLSSERVGAQETLDVVVNRGAAPFDVPVPTLPTAPVIERIEGVIDVDVAATVDSDGSIETEREDAQLQFIAYSAYYPFTLDASKYLAVVTWVESVELLGASRGLANEPDFLSQFEIPLVVLLELDPDGGLVGTRVVIAIEPEELLGLNLPFAPSWGGVFAVELKTRVESQFVGVGARVQMSTTIDVLGLAVSLNLTDELESADPQQITWRSEARGLILPGSRTPEFEDGEIDATFSVVGRVTVDRRDASLRQAQERSEQRIRVGDADFSIGYAITRDTRTNSRALNWSEVTHPSGLSWLELAASVVDELAQEGQR